MREASRLWRLLPGGTRPAGDVPQQGYQAAAIYPPPFPPPASAGPSDEERQRLAATARPTPTYKPPPQEVLLRLAAEAAQAAQQREARPAESSREPMHTAATQAPPGPQQHLQPQPAADAGIWCSTFEGEGDGTLFLYEYQHDSNSSGELTVVGAPVFMPSQVFQGPVAGYYFTSAHRGLGYYRDFQAETQTPASTAAAAAAAFRSRSWDALDGAARARFKRT